jgi:integrase
MAIYKRNGVWYTRIKDNGEWRKKSTGCTDRKAAEAIHAKRQRVAADPTAHASTFGELIAAFLGAEQVQSRAAGTQSMYRQKARHLLRVIGDATPAREVEANTVDAYCNQRLAEGAHRNTIAKELITLRGALRMALRAGTYTRPLDAVLPKWDAGYEPRTATLSPDRVRALLSALPPHRADYVRFCVATGARHSEAASVRRGDIATDHVHLQSTKTRRKGVGDRDVPITPLNAWLLEGITLPLRTWEAGSRTRDLAAACKRAGVPRVTANDLRRTYATWLAEAGLDEKLLQRTLGHSPGSPTTRRVYAQMSAQSLGDVVRAQLAASGTYAGHATADSTVNTALRGRFTKEKTPAFAGECEENRAGAGGLEPTTCGFGIRTHDRYLPMNVPYVEGRGTYTGHDRAAPVGYLAAFSAAERYLYLLDVN